MSLYLGENKIADNTSSRIVGEIITSSIPLADPALHLLDGAVINGAGSYAKFVNYIAGLVNDYPSLFETETNWQSAVTTYGVCGKFVYDSTNNTVRLPKITGFTEGTTDVTALGDLVEAGLPNIEGKQGGFCARIGNLYSEGALSVITPSSQTGWSGASASEIRDLVFDASTSNSIYGNSTTVQPQSIKVLYYIVIASSVTTNIDIEREIDLNNPFSLLDYKFSEYELSNVSWLRSNGQWNSGEVYTSVYNLLQGIYNGTTTKAGVSVKLSTETYADTDFVLNTSDTTFRLPTKVALASGKAVAGNGKALGLTDGTNNFGLVSRNATSANGVFGGYSGVYGANVGVNGQSGDVPSAIVTHGVTTDPTKSGIETSANGLYLYFYVGETVQDANLINAGAYSDFVSNLQDVHCVIETYVNGTSWYRIYSDGWVEQGGRIADSTSTSQINSLLLPMIDTNYNINITAEKSDWSGGLNSVFDLTTTSFKMWTSDDSSFNSCPVRWEVKGYKG